ncbi:transposase [Calothrix sp. NIES-4071]|nr:transposase [Calothrix sp. NIES-4071]BAZ60638.1 transposase [Calothrix sp. NIES-4105]
MSKGKRSKTETKNKYAGSVVVTRIAIAHNMEPACLEQLEEIARRCGILRSELWNKYGSLESWGVNKYEIDKQFRITHPPSRYGLTSKLYERTLYKCIDEIHTYQDAIKAAVSDEIYRKTDSVLERKYYFFLLDRRFWIDVLTTRARWLHRIIRKHLVRGHSNVRNQIVYNADMYRVKQVGKYSCIELATLVIGKRLVLPLHGNPDISGEIRVIISKDLRVEIHYPKKLEKVVLPNRSTEAVGIDRGFTEVYVTSNGEFYGSGLGNIITKEVEYRVERGRKRGKLHYLAQKYEKKGLHLKAENIRKNNLGSSKMSRQKRRIDGQLKTLVFTATVQIFLKYGIVVYEDLTEPIKDKKGLKGKAAAKMSSWCKGLVADALKEVSVRLSGQAMAVNAAYTSQTDCRYGVLLGERKADSFHCYDGVVLQSDINAARNILARKDDAEITRYMKFTTVKSILLRRTEQFKEARQRETAKTPDSQNPAKHRLAGFKGEQLSLFDTTLTHSESEV